MCRRRFPVNLGRRAQIPVVMLPLRLILKKDVEILVEQVLPNIYRFEVPIPKSPLRATNVYLVKGGERNLLIDTGVNNEKNLAFLRSGLADLAVDLQTTDIFVTHMHADHVGLVPFLKTETSVIYASETDANFINYFLSLDSPFDFMRTLACHNGLSAEEARLAIDRHPANAPYSRQALPFCWATGNTVLTVGDYRFTCIETPGHTMGHLCLYEADRKILFSGDHILGDISPNITCWDKGNPLGDFLSSLQIVASLPVSLVLPGHRRIFTDCTGRIKTLMEHHRQRIDETYKILADGPQTAYQVAARMRWDMRYRSWEDVAAAQKFFATGEALSHLRYLECKGLAQSVLNSSNKVYWQKTEIGATQCLDQAAAI